ncbi:MAG: hypothetical protein ABEJ57_01890 [Halobacteriaceae archaeon]
MSAESTDVGIGVTILFAVLAGGSVLLTFVAPSQTWSALGFGAAITFGSLLLVAQHWAAEPIQSDSH